MTKAVWTVVAAFVCFEIAINFTPYGYFIDELYYLACARHLAFGYVDHPPLSIGVLAAWTAVAGTSQLAIRIPAIASVAASIGVTAVLARKLGGGPFAQFLAALCAATSSIALILASFYSMNALELVLWPLAALALLSDDRRKWMALGVIFGLGLENKHTMIVLGVAFAIGFWRDLKTRGPWIAAAIAFALLLPNLLWQWRHGFPSLEFYRNAQAFKNVPTGPIKGLVNQILVSGPGAVFVWILGAAWLVRNKKPLGIAFVVLFVLMIASRSSRPDRIAPYYSVLFAAGAITVERWKLRALACIPPIGIAAALAPIATPLLSPERASNYARGLGVFPQVEKGKTSPLPQPLADRTGWPELAADVRRAVDFLTPEERARAIILCSSYGVAGAVERLAPDLPPVYATHNSYWEWGPPPPERDVVIAIDASTAPLFEVRIHEGVHHCPFCMSWRDGMEITIAKKPTAPLGTRWAEMKHFE